MQQLSILGLQTLLRQLSTPVGVGKGTFELYKQAQVELNMRPALQRTRLQTRRDGLVLFTISQCTGKGRQWHHDHRRKKPLLARYQKPTPHVAPAT